MTSEQSIHERVWALFEAYKAPGAVMFHIPNGEKRGPRTAAKLKRMGVVAGALDFLCGSQGRPFFLELKKLDGRLSKAQKGMINDWAANGVATFVAHSVGEAVIILQSLGVLRADINFIVTGDAEHSAGAQDGSAATASDPSIKLTQEAVGHAGVA